LAGAQFLIEDEAALNKQASRATARVIHIHARLEVHDAGYDETHFRRRVKLARALAAALGKLADQILIAATDDVRFYVRKSEALGADFLDEVRETVVVDVALTVSGRVEVDAVDDPLEQGICVGDGAQMRRKLFTDLVGQGADGGPDGVVRVLRFQGQVEAHQLLVVLDQFERLRSRANFLRDAVQFVVEHVAEALGEDEGEDEFFVLWGIFRATDRAGRVPNPGFKGFFGFGGDLFQHRGGPRPVLWSARF